MLIRSVALAEDVARDATSVRVQLADDRGWVLRVERAGRVVSNEAFADWHRLERRRALLEAEMRPAPS